MARGTALSKQNENRVSPEGGVAKPLLKTSVDLRLLPTRLRLATRKILTRAWFGVWFDLGVGKTFLLGLLSWTLI